MKPEDLNKDWDSGISGPHYSDDELRKMMYRSRFWIFLGMKRKDIQSFCWKVAALLVVSFAFEMFDGWFWSLVWVCIFVNLFDQHFGLRYLRSFPVEDTMLGTIDKGIVRVKRIMIVTRSLYVGSMAALVYLEYLRFSFHDIQSLLMAGLLLFVVHVNWDSSNIWTIKMKELKDLREEYKNGEPEEDEL